MFFAFLLISLGADKEFNKKFMKAVELDTVSSVLET